VEVSALGSSRVGPYLALILRMNRITVVGDDTINAQARTYAEYRVFAALARHTRSVRQIRRAASHRRAWHLRQGHLCSDGESRARGLAQNTRQGTARVRGHQSGRRTSRRWVGTTHPATALILTTRVREAAMSFRMAPLTGPVHLPLLCPLRSHRSVALASDTSARRARTRQPRKSMDVS
jgi:hypothetical protein